MSTLDEVYPTGGLALSVASAQIVEHLKEALKSVDNLENQKFSASFIKFVLDKIKTYIKASKNNITMDSFESLSILVFKGLFKLSDVESKQISDTIGLLLKSGLVHSVDKSLRGYVKWVLKKLHLQS